MAKSKEDELETAWSTGFRAAYVSLLGECLRRLGYECKDFERERLIAEREEAIATLRQWCGQFGDNDWTPDLCLSDIIEKHLMRDVEETINGGGN